MIKRLLNLHTIQKITLILTTLLLLPTSAWGVSYKTTGTITSDGGMGSGTYKYKWSVTGSDNKWLFTTTSQPTTNSTSFNFTYESQLTNSLSATFTNPTGKKCKINQIIIEIENNSNCTVSCGSSFNTNKSGKLITFTPKNNSFWSSGETITMNFNSISGNFTINYIDVQISNDDTNTDFTWQETFPPGVTNSDGTIIADISYGLEFTYALQNTSGRSVAYSSSDDAVATVDNYGRVTIMSKGNATITATFSDNADYYYSGDKTYSYNLQTKFSAPTISPNGGAQSFGQPISISYPNADVQPTIKYKWDSSNEFFYSENAPSVKTGELTAWGEIVSSGKTLISDTETTSFIASYDITVGGTLITSNNADNVFRDDPTNNEKVSFNPETNTLTLNNAVLTDNIVCNTTDLFIDIKGTNSITTNGEPAISTDLEAASPKISIKSTSNPIGSLILKNTSQVNPCGGVVKGRISITTEDPISIVLPDQYNLTSDTTHMAVFGKSYNLMIGGVTVSNLNASDIFGDGKAAYNPETNTLSLDGITTSMIYCQAPQPLTIEINGSNTVGMIVGYGGDENPLTIKKRGSSPASLDVNTNGEQLSDGMGPIFHFSSCTWGNGLYLEAYSDNKPISGVYYENTGERRQFKHATNSQINRVIFSENKPVSQPSIWVGGIEPNEEGKFTNDNDSIAGVWFDANSKTLTLCNASIYSIGNIVSSLSNLTIKLVGGQTEMGANKIISSNPEATLKFTTDTNNPGSISTSILPWEGFAGNPTFENKLVYLPNDDSKFIKVLEAPSIAYSNGTLSINRLSDGYGHNFFDCHYTITYGDGTTESGQSNGNVSYLSIEKQLKPCTITAYVEFKNQFNNTTSDIGTAKYFGFETEELVVPYQASINAPNILPALPDGVTKSFSITAGTDIVPNPINSETGVVTIGALTEADPFVYEATFSAPNNVDYTILNEPYSFNNSSGNATVESYYLGSFSVAVTKKSLKDITIEDIPNQTYTGSPITPAVEIKNGELSLTDDDCEIAYSNNTSVGTATVTVTPTETSFYSDSATKEFTITAKSIENADIVLDNGSELTYNEAKSVPTIKSASVAIGTETPATTIELTASDYTISYVQVNGDTEEAIEADKIINAGSYKMILTGKGNFSGTKTVAFTINPRPIETPIITLSATEFVYNTQAQKPTVTVQFTESTEVTKTIPATDYEVTYSGDCINVGSYTVSVSLKRNYSGSADGPSFTITKATITPTVTLEGWTYGATANEPSVTGNSGSGVVSYAYKLQHAAEEAYSATKPTNAGAYTVKASIAATANYEAATDSAHFTIAKAAGGLAYSTATASAELNGDGWTAPELKNPNSLAVTYTSSNTAVATISETGVVTLVGTGETTIKAASEGDANHEACEVQYTLTVSRGRALGYGVWVGETEVDEDNYIDILNDGEKDDDGEYTKAPSFIFNPKDTTLLIINSDAGMTIESRLPELKIHLSNDNKLKKIFFNNQGNSENTGKLLFTCDSNFPGSVTIGNTVGESAISGFASVSYEFNLQVLKPAKAKYANGQMTDSLGVVADTITVGVPLEPIKSDDKEELDSDDFTVTNSDGSTATLDLTSANVNNIYYTLPESTEGQGYDPETNTISVVDPMTDDAVEQIAAATTNKNATVGTSEYAESFVGLTFIVQGGEGVIRIDQETEEGYEFHLKIGDKPSIALKSGKEEIEYSLPDATYCWLYLVRKVALARGYTRVSKRDRAPGNVRLVKVQSKVVASTKSAAAASGGTVTPTANLAITGIVDIDKETPESKYTVETVNDKWYTIDGRRIDKPTQKGLYIRNRKKIVVK